MKYIDWISLKFILSQDDGQPWIKPPTGDKSLDFINEFCRLTDRLPDLAEPNANERIMWSLFRALYGEAHLPELKLCKRFEAWLKESVAALQPTYSTTYSTISDIPAQDAMKAVFEAVLGCRNREAVDIALHFELADAATTILALWDPGNEGPLLRTRVMESVDAYLDEVMATVDDATEESVKYWTRTLMLLTGNFFLSQCARVRVFSVCHGLDWLQCLAACALHLPQRDLITGNEHFSTVVLSIALKKTNQRKKNTKKIMGEKTPGKNYKKKITRKKIMKKNHKKSTIFF